VRLPCLRSSKKASKTVLVRMNYRATQRDKLGKAYALKESEEANADVLGHSLLTRARELAALSDCLCVARTCVIYA